MKRSFGISLMVLCICAVMAVVDGVYQANYAMKSAIKLVMFLAIPISFAFADKTIKISKLFAMRKKGMKLALGLGISVYAIILGGYFLLKDVFDFSAVTTTLSNNIGVTGKNFIFVSLYISFVNSLLEEFFFRGFAFLTLKKVATRFYAYFFSALIFALYHVAMMIGWFSWEVFLVILFGLFIGGLVFNFLNEQSNTIYPSWFVHMFANFAINTVGFILFGII